MSIDIAVVTLIGVDVAVVYVCVEEANVLEMTVENLILKKTVVCHSTSFFAFSLPRFSNKMPRIGSVLRVGWCM